MVVTSWACGGGWLGPGWDSWAISSQKLEVLEDPKLASRAPMYVSCPHGARAGGTSAAQLGAEAEEEEEGANGDGSSEVPSASGAGEGEGVLGGGEVGE